MYSQLNKRLQNVRSPQKISKGGQSKKHRRGVHSDSSQSSESTVILDLSSERSSTPELSSKESGEFQKCFVTMQIELICINVVLMFTSKVHSHCL